MSDVIYTSTNGRIDDVTFVEKSTNIIIGYQSASAILDIPGGGTGASTAHDAMLNLSYNTIEVASGSVTINGTIDVGNTVIPIVNGGTNANNATDALKNISENAIEYSGGTLGLVPVNDVYIGPSNNVTVFAGNSIDMNGVTTNIMTGELNIQSPTTDISVTDLTIEATNQLTLHSPAIEMGPLGVGSISIDDNGEVGIANVITANATDVTINANTGIYGTGIELGVEAIDPSITITDGDVSITHNLNVNNQNTQIESDYISLGRDEDPVIIISGGSASLFGNPLTTVHNELQTIQGGTTDEYYHLTNTEYTGTGTGKFVKQVSPVLSGSVGINTSTPARALEVKSSNTSSFGSVQLYSTSLGGVISSTSGSLGGYLYIQPQNGQMRMEKPSAGIDPAFSMANSSDVSTVRIASNGNSYLTVGNIGIGTSSPLAKLHISGSTETNLLQVENNTNKNILQVLDSGKVGINVASPSYPLSIKSTTAGAATVSIWTSIYGSVLQADSGASGSALYLAPLNGSTYLQRTSVNSALSIQDSSDVSRVVLRSSGNSFISGNLGLGTGTPNYKLDVSGGDIRITNTDPRLRLSDGNDYEVTAVQLNGTANRLDYGGVLSITGSNVGIGTTTPTAKLEVSGSTILGSKSQGNYAEFDSNGHLLLYGSASYWDDVNVPGLAVRVGGSAPTFAIFTGSIYANRFDNAQTHECHFSVQLPHGYKTGSSIHPHVHWAGSTSNVGDVIWQLDYTWASPTYSFPTQSTYYATGSTDGTVNKHLITSLGTISGDGQGLSSILMCRLSRLGTATADTYTGDAFLLSVDFHILKDSLGSNEEYTK